MLNRIAGLFVVAALAGCTAQASVPHHKGHNMARIYTQDEEGNIVETEGEDRAGGNLAGSVGRTVLIGGSQTADILDWRSDDDSAEEMLVTVGVTRPPVPPIAALPNGQYTPQAIPEFVATVSYPVAIIEYGIGGAAEAIVIDAFPEQKISLPASFVRVKIYNPSATPTSYFASVCKARGNPHLNSRLSVRAPIAVAPGAADFFVPAFARSVKIVRAIAATDLRGAAQVEWKASNGVIVDNFAVLALADIPEIVIPANSAILHVINAEASIQQVMIVWFLEP